MKERLLSWILVIVLLLGHAWQLPVLAEEENEKDEDVLEVVEFEEDIIPETVQEETPILIEEESEIEENKTTQEETNEQVNEEISEGELEIEGSLEPTLEPTPEVTPEPTEEPTIEPIVEPTPEVTSEPTVEPTPEIVPEPTLEPTVEPTETPEVVEELEEVNEEEVIEEVVEEEDLYYAGPSKITDGYNMSTAAALPIGDEFNDVVSRRYFTVTSSSQSEHWFKFNVSSSDIAEPGTYYELRIYNNSSSYAINGVRVVQSNGTSAATNKWGSIFIDMPGSIAANKMNIYADTIGNTGTHYIIVDTPSGFTGNIEIGLCKRKDDVGDYGNEMAINFGQTYTKEISGKSDFDNYKFTPTVKGKYKITFENKNYLIYNSTTPNGDSTGFMVVGIGDEYDSYKMIWSYGTEPEWDGLIYSGQSATGITEKELEAGKTYSLYIGGDFSKNSTEKRNEYGTYTFKIEPVNSKVAVTSVKLNKTNVTLALGKTETLKATVNPTNATNKNVTWSSSNTNVAKVDSNGKVTAVNGGTATITVTTQDGKKTAKATVTVNMPKVQAIAIYNSAHGADIRFKPVNGVRYYGIWRKRTNPVTKVLEEKIVKIIDANTYTEKEGGNFKWIDPYLKDKYTDKGKEWEGGWVYYVTARSTSNTNPSYHDNTHLTIDGPISNKLNLYRLRNPELKTATANGSGKVTVTWSDVPTAHAYEVQYTLDNGATWTKVPEVVAAYWDENGKEVKVPTYKPTVTVSGLPKGKKVAFRIRCRKTNTSLGVTWSEYSTWKTTTVK